MADTSTFREFVDQFKRAGIWGKSFQTIGLLASASSIASLSDAVFQWKGLILEAIEFYKLVVVEPAIALGRSIGLRYTPDEVHAAVLLSVSMSIGMRLLAVGQVAAFRVINERYGTHMAPKLHVYWILGTVGPLAGWISYGLSDDDPHLWRAVLLALLYPLGLVLPKLVLQRFGYEFFEKESFSYVGGYYLYLAAAFLAVAIMAAVNSGLTR